MIAVSKVCVRSFGIFSLTSPALVRSLRSYGAGIAPGFTPLIALRIAQPIRLGVEQRVQRLLHAAADHPVEMALDPIIINRNDIAQWTRCSLGLRRIARWPASAEAGARGRADARTREKMQALCTELEAALEKMNAHPELRGVLIEMQGAPHDVR